MYLFCLFLFDSLFHYLLYDNLHIALFHGFSFPPKSESTEKIHKDKALM